MQLDLIIPAYNEKTRIESTLRSYSEAIKSYEACIFVVDDGSQDNTAEFVRELASSLCVDIVVLEMLENKGKGAAVFHGFEHCRNDSDVIFFADADGATPATEFASLIKAWEDGFDVAIGSRALGKIERRQNWLRDFMGKTFNKIITLLLPLDISDTQCGFKLFRPEVVKVILELSTLHGFAFDVEFLIIANEHGFKIKEVPVSWEHQDASRVHIIKDSLRMLRDLIKINIKRIKGHYQKEALT